MRGLIYFCFVLLLFSSCYKVEEGDHYVAAPADKTLVSNDETQVKSDSQTVATDLQKVYAGNFEAINTNNVTPRDLVHYAESLTGTPYRYGSTDPRVGFDCSGFITYVFNHFKIAVPRSSVDFTNVEREINIRDAKRGDIILFTGTDSTMRVVGHMGIVTSNPNQELQFIHSTSGKSYGVTTTPLNSYYQGRFVKVLRIFKENDERH